MRLILPHEPLWVKSAPAGSVSGGLIPRRARTALQRGPSIPHSLGSCGGGAGCVEGRQLGSIQERDGVPVGDVHYLTLEFPGYANGDRNKKGH